MVVGAVATTRSSKVKMRIGFHGSMAGEEDRSFIGLRIGSMVK